jgi:putative hemolysin
MRIAASLGALALLAACAPAAPDPATPVAPTIIGLANPASVACGELFGGTLSIVEGPNGQSGRCTLPDGRVCEEWVLFQDHRCAVNRAGPSIGAPVPPRARPAGRGG